ncbi:MAG TPA: arabinan endo-1,5-alpha-L-arabinosidase [Acidimicrobiales bacterium]|nr:arabinan endo-1,5-alpha-L-arabinosidase [Acidimicrobiales bacterium]
MRTTLTKAMLSVVVLVPSVPAPRSWEVGPANAAVPVPGYVFIHDPTLAKEGNTWYLFSTGDPEGNVNDGDIQIRESTNLTAWKLVGTVFKVIPSWIGADLGQAVTNLWAPDISYFAGTYHLYYAASSFGSNDSLIALATNPTLDPTSRRYHWTDMGEVFSSNSTDNYNAIDPALVMAQGNAIWLLFGSFWSGIKLLRLNAASGKPPAGSQRIFSLSEAAPPDPEEGAYIVWHSPYYFLFVSAGACCKGIGSTYHVIVGRSTRVVGPYTDPNGTVMTSGGGMEFLGSDEGMIGPGSPSVYSGPTGDLIVYHYYDAWDSGGPWVQVRRLEWAPGGWPVSGPPIVPVPGAPD